MHPNRIGFQKASTWGRDKSQCHYHWLLNQPQLSATFRGSSLITCYYVLLFLRSLFFSHERQKERELAVQIWGPDPSTQVKKLGLASLRSVTHSTVGESDRRITGASSWFSRRSCLRGLGHPHTYTPHIYMYIHNTHSHIHKNLKWEAFCTTQLNLT